MGIKDVNRIFGYAYFIVGVAKIILIVLLFTQFTSTANSIFSGDEYNSDIGSYATFSLVLGCVQIAFIGCSVIMIFVNIFKQPNAIWGYVVEILAVLLEILLPSGMFLYFALIPKCYLYMETGKRITRACNKQENEFFSRM